ncbi:purine-nucleoside phosphorylase [Chitinivibrio alkaliphilus]|uniref:purine-nucleoside phosphorylase n=1 Tax=Chitinivibrio alkaliphilus ACht1 TaxID=1313304 RepID=U7DBW5_9BACT|nr:purine-nucleoside phosphorylase [Chitinivibrio alkaliphilus]ERP39073.1 purine nucleoside phosphorylase [Chitinivibrio alkaliphilus ACht1]
MILSPPLHTTLRSYNLREALILGSGWNNLVHHIKVVTTIPYHDIEPMPHCTTSHHRGNMHVAQKGSKHILIFEGRSHLYECYTPQQVVTPVYIAQSLGIETLLLTNASGACCPTVPPGALFFIEDHINLTGCSPLRGTDNYKIGPRYPSLHEVYSGGVTEILIQAGRELSLPTHCGVYAGISGPETPTPAENAMYRMWGAHTVGMSTVMEAIAAAHCGMRVGGISLVTDSACDSAAPALPRAAQKRAKQTEQKRNKFILKVLELLWHKATSKRLTQR